VPSSRQALGAGGDVTAAVLDRQLLLRAMLVLRFWENRSDR
jgi:hypothetical protein